MKTSLLFWAYLARFFLEWEMFQTKVVEKIKTHILCLIPPPPENFAVYEIMWKNGGVKPQITVWSMRITCRIPKSTNTQTKYVILIAFPLQQWLHGRASMFCYTYIACLLRRSVTKQKERTPVSIRLSACDFVSATKVFVEFSWNSVQKVAGQAQVLWKSAPWYCVL
jgi:hypothetical protein